MKIGICQLLVEGGEPSRNLQRAQSQIEFAAKSGCDVALLPETLDLGWTHPSVYNESENIPGNRSNFFCSLAKENAIWLCLGLTEKRGGKIYNTALLIDDFGEIIYQYDKINLLKVEFPFYEVGSKLSVIETRIGKIGINICADNYKEAYCLGHSLARMGAQIILSPSSWTVDYFYTEEMDPYKNKWIEPLSDLATLFEIPIVSATSVGYIVGGPYEGKKMIGRSLAIDKYGKVFYCETNEFAGDVKIVELELGNSLRKGVEFDELLNREKNKSK